MNELDVELVQNLNWLCCCDTQNCSKIISVSRELMIYWVLVPFRIKVAGILSHSRSLNMAPEGDYSLVCPLLTIIIRSMFQDLGRVRMEMQITDSTLDSPKPSVQFDKQI